MILAGICSALFSFAIPVAVAAGGGDQDEQTVIVPNWCNVSNPDELSTQIKSNTESAKKEELESCLNKIQDSLDEMTIKTGGDNAEEMTTNQAKLNQAKLTEASEALSLAILGKDTTIPIKKHVETALNITDMRENPCLCVPKEGKSCTDANNIIAIVEEPLETELTNTDQTKVRICTRNTFCVRRVEKGEQECITYLNAKKTGDKYEPFCSTQASNYMKAHPGDASLYCQPVQVFLSSTGTDLLFVYISTIYKWAASVIGIIAVLVIVISGIQISAAAGDQQAVTNAKNRIVQTLGGLALLFLSAIILYTINPNFFTAG